MKLTHLLAKSLNNCIGKGNTIPWKCRADMRHFAQYTKGKILIMGRKTFDSINPPLKGRQVIVVTRNQDTIGAINEVECHHAAGDLTVAIKMAESLGHSMDIDETVIVGGAEIYRQTADIVDSAIISIINTEVEDGDTFVNWDYNVIGDHTEITTLEFNPDY